MKINKDFITDAQLRFLRRDAKTPRLQLFVKRMGVLFHSTRFLERESQTEPVVELYRYIPTACVAALQGYFTELIANVIDIGNANRGAAIFKDLHFSLDSIFEIRKASLTPGDIAASAIHVNSISQIEDVMSKLLGCDFHHALKSVAIPVAGPNGEPSSLTLGEYEGVAFPILEEMFINRNIVCHELSNDVGIDASKAYGYASWTMMYGIGTELLGPMMFDKCT